MAPTTARLGNSQVVARAYAFDINGKILAVLVERSSLDEEGLPIRGIDWYAVDEPAP
jgi:hypothetical protein